MFLLDMRSAFIMLWKIIAALYQTSNGIQDVFLCIFFLLDQRSVIIVQELEAPAGPSRMPR